MKLITLYDMSDKIIIVSLENIEIKNFNHKKHAKGRISILTVNFSPRKSHLYVRNILLNVSLNEHSHIKVYGRYDIAIKNFDTDCN
jgi:hypothetical protein